MPVLQTVVFGILLYVALHALLRWLPHQGITGVSGAGGWYYHMKSGTTPTLQVWIGGEGGGHGVGSAMKGQAVLQYVRRRARTGSRCGSERVS